jgi:hypothetical protein
MLRPIRIATLALLAALAPSAGAQNRPAGLQPLPELPPSTFEQPLDPSSIPALPGEVGYHENKVNGLSYTPMVVPPQGRPYYLIDNRGDANSTWSRRGSLDSNLRVPQWLTGKF